MKNKNGIINPAIIIPVVLLILFIIMAGVLGRGSADKELSDTPIKEGCKPEMKQVKLTGLIEIFDGAWGFGVEPEISSVGLTGAFFDGQRMFAWSEPFDWTIAVYSDKSDSKTPLDSTKGEGVLTSDKDFIFESFVLYYKLPDNDCDGKIDDHTIRLVAKLKETKDLIIDEDTYTVVIRFENGRVIQQ